MKNKAVFLDRDGTIVGDPGYIGNPDDVKLVPGSAEAIRRLSEGGHLVVIVSNQSGVARGRFDEAALSAVHARVEALLRQEGAHLDGAYYCPYLNGPDAVVEAYRRDSDLRKPNPGMLLQAARDLEIDLAQSWMIGDSPSDVEAGQRAGCRTILIQGEGYPAGERCVAPNFTAGGLLEAAEILNREIAQGHSEKRDTSLPAHDDKAVEMLARIHDLLDRAQRRQRQHDFSVLRLFGALLQMFAVVAALWGVFALLDEQAPSATARLMFACFLQLASISTFAVDRFR
jgi:D-glycero-D-manno-heptose 1,7-bisphosphate phosphatase